MNSNNAGHKHSTSPLVYNYDMPTRMGYNSNLNFTLCLPCRSCPHWKEKDSHLAIIIIFPRANSTNRYRSIIGERKWRTEGEAEPATHLPLYYNLIERRKNVDNPKTCSKTCSVDLRKMYWPKSSHEGYRKSLSVLETATVSDNLQAFPWKLWATLLQC